MEGWVDAIWSPWLAYTVLGVGLLVTAASGVVQLRRLGSGLRLALSRRGARDSSGLSLLLAAAAGMASIAGAAIAFSAGGPGALVWMWIATLLGMAITHAEWRLGSADPEDRRSYLSRELGGFGRLLAVLSGLGLIGLVIVVGGAFQTNQAAVVIQGVTGLAPRSGAAVVAVAAAPFLVVASARRFLLRVAMPSALVVLTLGLLFLALADGLTLQLMLGDAMNAAFGVEPMAGGTAGGAVGAAVYHGVLRATLAGGAGTSIAAVAARHSDGKFAPAAALVPLLAAGVVSTATFLAIASGPATDAAVAETNMIPLERAHSRGLRKSLQVGQTIVLPEDSPLQERKHYGIVLRANPRGHRLAELVPDNNVIVLPNWKIAAVADTAYFRARDEERAKVAGWDIPVRFTREVVRRGNTELLVLTPEDPELNLKEFTTQNELATGPHVVLGDFSFAGYVSEATTADGELRDHLSMYEAPSSDRPPNPELHIFFRNGYRGPYADDGTEAAPWGFIAREGYDAPIGSVVALRFRANPRGDDVLRVNRIGGIEAPPWDFMMAVDTVVLRHDTDPTRDIRIRVAAELDEYRVRLGPIDAQWSDFRKAATKEGFNGPFAQLEDQVYDFEVRSDSRLSEAFAGRRALIPLHPQTAVAGPGPDTQLPYRPHPGELVAAKMSGLFEATQGAGALAKRWTGGLPRWSAWVLVLAIFAIAVASVTAWTELGARGVASLFGGGATAGRIAVLGAAGAGGVLGLTELLPWVDAVLALAVAPVAIGLLLLLGRVRDLTK